MAEREDKTLRVRARQMDPSKFPDLENINTTILREGPRSRTELKYTRIKSRHTGEFHHDSLTTKSYKKLKSEWQTEPTKSISLSGGDSDELQRIIDFIRANREGAVPAETNDFLVVRAPDDELNLAALGNLLNDLQAGQKVDVLVEVLENAASSPGILHALLERAAADPKLFAEAAAALNLATYRAAVNSLRQLIDDPRAREQDFQRLLEENPWMFGSEYSERLDNRNLTRDEQHDFVMRLTTDNYLELIEIKKPLNGHDLFVYDRSHDCYYQSAEVSKVVGQVQHYLEKLDSERYTVIARDREDPFKVRAKIIIGRDGNKDQCRTLRLLNAHLHRIEIVTFDQLLRIADSVLSYLESAIRPAA